MMHARRPTADLPIGLENVTRRQPAAVTILDRITLSLDAGHADRAGRSQRLGQDDAVARRHGPGRAARTGRITWAGVEHSPPTRRAIVFQRPAMLRRSAAANVRYALRRGRRQRGRRAAPHCRAAGAGRAGHVALRPARRLSGGEQQRLALARALARDPDVLFLDEPTASLDPAVDQGDRGRRSATVSQRGIKVVMSTHDLGEARRLAGEIVLLHRGRLIETGPAPAFFNTPRTGEAQHVHRRDETAASEMRLSDEVCRNKMIMLTRRALSNAARRWLRRSPFAVPAMAQEKSIVVASTTSTQDSGLFGYLLPLFKAKTGIEVRVVALGTGQALDVGRRGDADVVFVHARSEEDKFLAEGLGVKRYPVMYNDFVLIGPKSDPAGIKGSNDIVAALKTLKDKQRRSSRAATSSGTHIAELKLWKDRGHRHREGEGPVVQGDRAGHGGRAQHRAGRRRLCAGRPRHLALVQEQGRARHRGAGRQAAVQPVRRDAGEPGRSIRSVKKELGQAFIDWLVSPEGQRAIADYKINGEQLFFPNAGDPDA